MNDQARRCPAVEIAENEIPVAREHSMDVGGEADVGQADVAPPDEHSNLARPVQLQERTEMLWRRTVGPPAREQATKLLLALAPEAAMSGQICKRASVEITKDDVAFARENVP
jgi:hypothetical protein